MFREKIKHKITILSIIVLTTSCKIFAPQRMFVNDRNITYSEITQISNEQYRISIDDEIFILVRSNNGETLVDATGTPGTNNLQNQMGYIVEKDGNVRLPLVGYVNLLGKTIKEAEKILEEKYSTYFVNPFVKVKVTSNRIIVLKGGNTSQVINLTHPDMTLFEAIALSGGIGDSKAHKIKLIRNNKNKIEVYKIDLSKISNINQGNIVLQANDIIYIEPRDRIAQEILTNITPYLSLITTILTIYALFLK